MGAWNTFADTYGTDKALAGLDAEQIRAVVEVLLLVMYADGRASVMERMELGELLDKLPAMDGKTGVVEAHVEAARERAEKASGDDIAAFTRSAAARLPDKAARAVVFRMATALATADLQLGLPESAVLTALADAFGIAQEEAQLVIDEHN